MKKLDGPFIAPKSGKAKNMVIILHGYGDSGQGILGLGQEWSREMPDTVFIAPNGIEPCGEWAAGFQWFPIRAAEGISTKAFDRKELIDAPHQALDAFINEQLVKWNIDDKNLIITGFSQGAMMAMYVAPRRKKPCAGVIGYSGIMAGGAGLKEPGIVKVPVLAIHGDADDVVPVACLADVDNAFNDAGFNVETVIRPGLPHSIDQFGLMRGLEFMREQLDKAS